MRTVFHNGRVLIDGEFRDDVAVVVEDGRIAAIAERMPHGERIDPPHERAARLAGFGRQLVEPHCEPVEGEFNEARLGGFTLRLVRTVEQHE